MITPERMQALEANSAWLGVSRRLLMENAGAAVARELVKRGVKGRKVVVFAGLGNNGGDGFVVARHLSNHGARVEVLLLGSPSLILTEEARANWKVLQRMRRVSCRCIPDSSGFRELKLEADFAVDAMLGTGAAGEPREPIASAVRAFNALEAFKVAVDLPTGVNALTGETARNTTCCDLTITFHDLKPGLEQAERFTGEVIVADIGIPQEAETTAGPGDVLQVLPKRKFQAHKGEHGRLLVVGGSSRYHGAPALAGLAALRAGVDLAVIAAPAPAASVISSFSPDLIPFKLPGEDLEPGALLQLEEPIARSTALLVGPGLGAAPATKQAMVELAQRLNDEHPELPVIFDADGLKALAGKKDLLKNPNWVVTPHAHEFKILTGLDLPEGLEDRGQRIKAAAQKLGCVVLLKAHVDVVASPEGKVTYNLTGNPGMTVGGTGDVLAGVVGAFLAQGAKPFRAAVAGAFLCGLAGDLCLREKGYEFLASDVIEKLPKAFQEVRRYG